MRRPAHFVKDFGEISEIIVFLAKESRQQEMGELDGALLAIGNDQDDINFRQQPTEHLHPLKLFSIRCRENGDRIRFYGRPESFPEFIQSFKEFFSLVGDHRMNGGRESLHISIISA
jgi:hypothetical protein